MNPQMVSMRCFLGFLGKSRYSIRFGESMIQGFQVRITEYEHGQSKYQVYCKRSFEFAVPEEYLEKEGMLLETELWP